MCFSSSIFAYCVFLYFYFFFSRSVSLSLSLTHTHTHTHTRFLCFSNLLSAYCGFLVLFICPISFFCDFIPVCILFLSVFLSHFLSYVSFYVSISLIVLHPFSLLLHFPFTGKKYIQFFPAFSFYYFKRVLFILSKHFYFCIILAFSYEVFSSLFNFRIYLFLLQFFYFYFTLL